MSINQEALKEASESVDAILSWCGFPDTRSPGTEAIDSREIARVAIEAYLEEITRLP